MARVAALARRTGQRSQPEPETAPAMVNAVAAPSINCISGLLGMISISPMGRPN
jgi:hypothetical protein